MSQSYPTEKRKALGAFYTDEVIASYLVDWGLQEGSPNSVLDPSVGDGRFLQVAGQRGVGRLVACDVDPLALEATRERLGSQGLEAEFICGDFFAVEPESLKPVELVVGNPPFIRYQRFTGETRERALRSARRLGVELTGLSSSWAPFLLHVLQFLVPGGRLAMVVPAEIIQTRYGLIALRALLKRFGEVRLLAFENNLFEDAQTEVCLLLAAEYGSSCNEVGLVPLHSLDDLQHGIAATSGQEAVRVPVSAGTIVRFAEAFLSKAERRVWKRLQRHRGVRTVASLGTVANGYVSGANDFFHRTRSEAEKAGFPQSWLYPVARSSRSLAGLYFTRADVRERERRGTAHHLVVPAHDLFDEDGEKLADFIDEGERLGVSQRFKCRNRSPWWRVPGLLSADLFVSYMIGQHPRASVNQAGCYYTNSLHGVRLADGDSAEHVALSFFSSLTLLSLEIEGRTYGGGILKVEPRELDRVLLAWPTVPLSQVARLAQSADHLLRAGEYESVVELVDRTVLVEGLGVDTQTVRCLREARQRLVQRRVGRARRKVQ